MGLSQIHRERANTGRQSQNHTSENTVPIIPVFHLLVLCHQLRIRGDGCVQKPDIRQPLFSSSASLAKESWVAPGTP
jgi:hypothetical protein